MNKLLKVLTLSVLLFLLAFGIFSQYNKYEQENKIRKNNISTLNLIIQDLDRCYYDINYKAGDFGCDYIMDRASVSLMDYRDSLISN